MSSLSLLKRHAAPFFSLLLLLGGCSGLQYRQLATTAQDLPPAYELTDTPFFPQEMYHCGPATLATTLTDAGVETTPEKLAELAYLPKRKGSLAIELKSAVRHYAYLPYELKPSLPDLLTEIANGRPVIVLQNLGLNWIPRWHYAVAIGYDLPQQHIILRSGRHERVLIDMSTFERTWRRSGYWALLTLPPGALPATAEEFRYLQAVVGLEHNRHWQAARKSYAAAVKQWPESKTAWMGLGNSAYAEGDLNGTAHAYRQALVIDDRYAPAYNNLAQVLAEQAYWTEAEQMARHAVNLSGPHIDDYKKTLDDILQKKPK